VLGLPTNRAFLAACLQHPVFANGQALVPFLAEHAAGLQELLLNKELLALVHPALEAIFASNPASDLPCSMTRPLRLRHQGEVHVVAVRELGSGRLQVEQAGAEPTTITLQLPQRGVHYVAVEPLRWHWQIGGVDGWVEDASWEPAARADAAGGATELRAPFNGKVVALPVAAGQALVAGDTVVVIESMKLEHSLACPAAGTLAELLVAPGQQVSPGQVLARYTPATQGAPT
jgi:geranyl-CoA carboxylase alpha subunit